MRKIIKAIISANSSNKSWFNGVVFIFVVLLAVTLSVSMGGLGLSPLVWADLVPTGVLTTREIKDPKAPRFVAELKSGYHFNLKAPSEIVVDGTKSAPKLKSRQKMEFALPQIFAEAKIRLYICDDPEKFCEPKEIALSGSAAAPKIGAAPAQPEESGQMPKAQKAKAQKAKPNKMGFYEASFEFGQAEAKKQNKILFVDLGAQWCPSCVMLESAYFNTSDFQRLTHKMIKLKLNYDLPENAKLAKQQLQAEGIPILVLFTPDGQEIGRVGHWSSLAQLSAQLQALVKDPQPTAALRAKAQSGDSQANLALGMRLYSGGQRAEAADYLAKVTPEPIELIDAQIQQALKREKQAREENSQSQIERSKEAAALLRQALGNELNTTRSLAWRASLARLLRASAKKSEGKAGVATATAVPQEIQKELQKLAAEGRELEAQLQTRPELWPQALKGDALEEFVGLERFFFAVRLADLISETALDEAERLAVNRHVAEVAGGLSIPLSRPGSSLRMLLYMMAGHQFDQAEQLARRYLKLHPRDPEWERRLAKILNEQKKFKEAAQVGERLQPRSYGTLQVYVAYQLAKSYIGLGQTEKAAKLVSDYLADPSHDWNSLRSEREMFEDLLKSIRVPQAKVG